MDIILVLSAMPNFFLDRKVLFIISEISTTLKFSIVWGYAITEIFSISSRPTEDSDELFLFCPILPGRLGSKTAYCSLDKFCFIQAT